MSKCDIIIPVWNLLKLTKDCIESVLEKTAFPFHLIIIDNGSSEPTKNYLARIAQDNKDKVTLIINERNMGFVKAANQGITHSRSDYLCLLNNDTKVTSGWLAEMIKVAESSKDIGIVNANSNTLGCKLEKGQSLEALAKKLKSYTGRYTELAWATGFCMLIKREVIQKVGLFDEIYEMGNFEDADFCKRAQGFGYLCVCAQASYVFHHELSSFIKLKEFKRDFARIRQLFYAKWGRQKRLLYILTKEDFEYKQKIAQEALKLARQGNIVWIFVKDQEGQEMKAHSNIYVYNFQNSFFNLISLWRILKRKKRFDRIYVDDESCASRLNNFRFLHKAEVSYAK